MFMCDEFNIVRFVDAQDDAYERALKELQGGRKRSCWMWYIFPQLKDLGYSRRAKFYGISGIEEARVYHEHPVLGPRLREVTETILNLPGDDAVAIFGEVDAMKLHSSMTLFDAVSPNDIYALVLYKFFDGRVDHNTVNFLD